MRNLERVFEKFSKQLVKILLGDSNAKVGREDIFKTTIGNEILHENNNDNVNFATSRYLIDTSTMSQHRKHVYIYLDIS
jgi:hypothetical protein